MAQAQWKTQSFEPKKLQLDPQNPRIEVEKNATQEQSNSPTTTVLDGQYSSGVKRWLTSATSKAAGSNEPPIHSLRLSCSGSLGSASAARKSS